MRLKKIILSNFQRMGTDVEVPLDLPGLTLISGENKDAPKANSNGSGKSTVLYGIVYALYGKCPNGSSADEVIHEAVGQDCKVELHLETDAIKSIVITRFRNMVARAKPNDLLLCINGIDKSGSTNELTQENIDKLIGMDFHTFCALMPGLGVQVASLTDSAIKLLLEKLLGTEELSKAHKLANDKFKAVCKDVEIVVNNIKNTKENVTSASLRLAQYERSRDVFESKKAEELSELQTKLKSAKKLAKKAISTYKLTKAAIPKKNDDEITLARSQVEDAKMSFAEAEKDFQTSVSLLKGDIAVITHQISTIKSQVKEINSLTSSCPTCPTCLGEVADEHKRVVIDKLNEESALREEELIKLQDELTALSSRLVYREKEKLLEEKQAVLSDLVKLNQETELARKELSLLKEKASTAVDITNEILTQIDAVSNRENVFQDLCLAESTTVRNLTTMVTDLTKELEQLTESKNLYKFWVDSFAPAGLRSYMMENVTPFLNERAKYYSDVISEGEMSVTFQTKSIQKSGKIVEKFKIEVTQQHGSSAWKSSSNGEKGRANLVVSLVLGDLAALRSQNSLQFRAIDEVLDAVDAAGDDAIVSLLGEMAGQFGSIYLITHKTSLRNRIAREIVIKKENGFSSLKEITEKEIDHV